jgi:hypothetical protein
LYEYRFYDSEIQSRIYFGDWGDTIMVFADTASKVSLGAITRFVRTDFYFDPEDVNPVSLPEEFGERPSLSAVWLKGVNESFLSVRGFELALTNELMLHQRGRTVSTICLLEIVLRHPGIKSDLPSLIELTLFYSSRWSELLVSELDESGIPLMAMPIVKKLLAEKVVIETSPPIAETLAHFLRHATSISLGVLLGMGVTHDPLIMVITIPAGVILMGAAMGITKGLERGLAKRVEAAIVKEEDKPKPQPRPKKKPKDE